MVKAQDQSFTLSYTKEALAAFSLEELFYYFREVSIIHAVIGSAANSPRLVRGDKFYFTKAGDAVDELWEFFGGIIENICSVAIASEPKGAEEAKYKTLIQLSYYVQGEDDIDTFNTIAAKGMKEIAEAYRMAEIATMKDKRAAS